MATVTSLDSQLEALFGQEITCAPEPGSDADRIAILEARSEQLKRQHEVVREECERNLAKSLEERDARLNEQRSYMERLEREVAERTQELREKTDRLKRANDRMKRDLTAAAKIQKSLLPTQLPTRAGVRFAYAFQPCDELAGDSLNVFPLDDRHLGLYLLDVSGHGVPAALLSVTLSQFLFPSVQDSSLVKRTIAQPPGYEIVAPANVAAQLNQRFLMDGETRQYFTIVYGILDLQERLFRYISAGHPGLVYAASNDACRHRVHPGFPIGCFEEADWEEHEVPLDADDRLYLYSDGVTEGMNEDKIQFGKQRLCSLVEDARELPLQDSVTSLLETVINWSGGKTNDDVSVLAIEMMPDKD
jgi:sigma-B regulation protein RsbU (phosphoserine phosphatase)